MPFIDCKFSKKLTEEEKENVKSEFGQLVRILHKPESYLMVGIDDGYDLYFAGKKLENGAYVSVSLFGKATAEKYGDMTKAVCELVKRVSDTDGGNVYVTYSEIENWGHDGYNF